MKSLLSNRKFLSILIPCIIGWAYCALSIYILKDYGYVLFMLVPGIVCALSAFIISYKNHVTLKKTYLFTLWTLGALFLGVFFIGIEGLICGVMAFPFAAAFGFIGAAIGYEIANMKFFTKKPQTMIMLILMLPILMSFENQFYNKEKIFSITTSIEINSTPEKVWENVIAFPQLDEPTEFIFKTGIAYPTNAQINGKGVGAIRHCNFSTGSFVEPITEWEERKILGFDVTQQPEPMKELSLYDIHPNHLHGYFASQKGQFRINKLPNGNILLVGTTWYVNNIKPDFYWTLWSDFIVHKIHTRVLEHIKKQCEK